MGVDRGGEVMSNHDKGIEAAALHNHAPIPDDLADTILYYGHECGEFAKEPSHIFGRQRLAKALAVLHAKIAAYLAEAQPTSEDVAQALDFEGVVGFLSDLMDDVRNGHTFNAKEQAEILINLACEPLRRGRPIRATQPTSEGEERVVVAEGTWDEYGTQVVDADRIPLVDIQPIVDGTAKFDGHLVRVVVEVIP